MKIGNFRIEQQNGNTIVNYHRTVKDWVDILVYLVLGGAASAFIIIMYQYTHFRDWIYWIVAGLFAFFAFLKWAEGLTRLTQSTRSIIVVNRVERKLIAKYPYLRKTIINLEDISSIQLSGINERIRTSKARQIRTYSKVEILDNQGKLITILLINTKQLFRISNKKIEAEVYEIGQKIAKILSKETNAKYQWTGFHEIST